MEKHTPIYHSGEDTEVYQPNGSNAPSNTTILTGCKSSTTLQTPKKSSDIKEFGTLTEENPVISQCDRMEGIDPHFWLFFVGQATTHRVRTQIHLTGASEDLGFRISDRNGRILKTVTGAGSRTLKLDLKQDRPYYLKVFPQRSGESDYQLDIKTPKIRNPLNVVRSLQQSALATVGEVHLEGSRLSAVVRGTNRSYCSVRSHKLEIHLLDSRNQQIHSSAFWISTKSGGYFRKTNSESAYSYTWDLSDWNLTRVSSLRVKLSHPHPAH